MQEVYVVKEKINDFILGIYSSEASYIKNLFEFLEKEEGGYDSEEDMLPCKVNEDFAIFKVPLDDNCEIYHSGKEGEYKSLKGHEVKNFVTYRDLKERLRELNIDSIVD
jgi:hypothetical protein